MTSSNRDTRLRARLLASATTGVVALHLGTPAMAQSSVDIDLLDQQPTRLTTATALIANVQVDSATLVSAAAANSSGAVDIRIDLLSSGADALSGSFSADGNTISAEAYSNSATNQISATTTPTFADSSAVSNLQSNYSDVTAGAVDNSIVVNVEASGGAVRRLDDGTVVIDGNEISSAANGNNATNTITIADSVSVTGTGAGTTTLQAADFRENTGSGNVEDVIVDADLSVANAQVNDGDLSAGLVVVTGAVTNAEILASIEEVSGSTVVVSDNVLSASARGNTASSTIDTGENAATISASMSVSNLQANEQTVVNGSVSSSRVAIETSVEDSGATIGSTLTIDNTDLLASAYGNNGTQTLSIDANAINGAYEAAATIGQSTGAGFSGDAMTVNGMAAISNLQLAGDSPVTATVASNTVEIEINPFGQDSQGVRDDTVTIADTTMDATAVGNRSVSSAVSLTGNDVGTGVAVASAQKGWDSTTTARASNNEIQILNAAESGYTDSSVSLQDSLIRALALSNTATTTIVIDGNDVTLDSNAASVSYDDNRDFDSGDIADVTGSFITLNDQSVSGDTFATASGNVIEIRNVGDDTEESSLSLTGNDVLAAAISNDGSNAITLSTNAITQSGGASGSGFATVAAAVSQQQLDDAFVEAQAIGTMQVFDDNDLRDSTLTVSGNSVEAMAMGNRVTSNTVTVEATNINTDYAGADPDFLEIDSGSNDPRASFLAVNAQMASGATIDAFLTDTVTGQTDSMEIEAVLDEDISNSTATAAANALRASATANSAANAVILTVDGTSATSTGVANEQEVDDVDLNVTIGVAGTQAVSYSGFTITGSTVNDTGGGGAGFGVFTGSIAGLTSEQIASLTATYGGTPDYTLDLAAQTISFTAVNNTASVAPPAGTIAGTDQEGGVFIRFSSGAIDSTIDITGNLTEGKATGNTVTNTLSLSGNTILDGGTNAGAFANEGEEAIASNMIQSTQEFWRSDMSVNVAGAFAIDTVTDNAFSGSTLTVSGNTQLASATANTGTSVLTVEGNEVGSYTALQSDQSSASGSTSTSSDLWVFAPTAINGSSLTLADNVGQAQTRVNVATNTVAVSGTTLSVGNGSAETDLAAGTSGGIVLYSDQSVGSGSAASSLSDIVVVNEHASDGTTVGTENSSIAFTGNVSLAETTANRATNTLSLDGTNLDSTAALGSEQASYGTVSASATGTVLVDMTANVAADAVILNSSVAVDGNAVSALGTANQVSNSVDISATNVSGGDSMAAVDYNNSAFGTFVLGNGQFNFNSVDAAAANVTYSVDMNSIAVTANGAQNSTVTVDGNATTAQALGNRSTNALNADVSNTEDASYAIDQTQLNNGDLTASVANLDATIVGAGVDTVAGSTLSVAGNSSLANAIGNTTSNALVLNANSVQAAGGSAQATGTVLNATAGVANSSTNTGDITATSNGVSYGVALNASDEAMTTASVGVSGNTVTSQAIANSGYNSLTVVALADDTANYGVSNYQSNTGLVTATVQTADIGVTSVGIVSGSMTSVSSNAIGSVAIGNTVTNVLLR